MIADFLDTVEKYDAINSDIIRVIEKNFPRACEQVQKFAQRFKTGNRKQECYRVWKFLREMGNYQKDSKDVQRVKLPARFQAENYSGDCKSFSLFAASCLAAIGHQVSFRYASFSSSSTPTHVYVIDHGANDIIIDAVYSKFDAQVPPRSYFDHRMRVETLSGIGSVNDLRMIREDNPLLYNRLMILRDMYKQGNDKEKRAIKHSINYLLQGVSIEGIGKHHQHGDRASGTGADIKKFAFAPGRNAFLALVALNVHNAAVKIAKGMRADQARVRTMWQKLGGDFNKLKAAVNKGMDKKPIFGIFDDGEEIAGIGVAGELSATIAAAAPVIVVVVKELKKILDKSGNPVDDGSLLDAAKDAGGDMTDHTGKTASDPDPGAGSGFSLNTKWLIPVAAGAAALMFL